MNKISIAFIAVIFSFLGSTTSYAQLTKKELRKTRPTYIKIGTGIQRSNFRDFATSPLFYAGGGLELYISRLRFDEKKEGEYGIQYSFGSNRASSGTHETFSTVRTVSLYYRQLYQIPSISNDLWNFKAGASLMATGNYRYNPSLQNNSTGLEGIINLFGSVKVTRDISRNRTKSGKFLFIPYTLLPRKKELSFLLNTGIINSSYRNSYIYTSFKTFDHEFSFFSGFRMNTALTYTSYLKNKNALQFSYVWDAYKTGGDLDSLEMATHSIRFAFLFNTK
ncbi:hypothetical protein HN014_18040 [Aquimarina sp. TRL1]|uniref:hypothetical protein n=1 Tax=Aquimarina sp. (strain TRL1) TaxID=2736252 RepID=UPI001588F478|nr:hypothetical protein [Aquimarina sp. TRL1]QKX06737.1 hypothetical protein HN014_18040 [Aquimarina sp. TRL1]